METATVRILITALAAFVVFASASSDAAGGLALNFYDNTCPAVYDTVQNIVGQYMSKAPSLAAPLLRMHFHDCFIRVSTFNFGYSTVFLITYIVQ